jgi:hypothetical protein
MNGQTNHRRVLHFAVTGALLGGAIGCTASKEPTKGGDAKADAKQGEVEQPEPDMKFAPNPGPEERNGTIPSPDGDTKGPVKMVNPGVEPEGGPTPIPEPTTAVILEPPPVEPEGIGANQGPVKAPVAKPAPVKSPRP